MMAPSSEIDIVNNILKDLDDLLELDNILNKGSDK